MDGINRHSTTTQPSIVSNPRTIPTQPSHIHDPRIDNVELHGLGSSVNCLGRRITSYTTRDAKEIAKLLAMLPWAQPGNCELIRRLLGLWFWYNVRAMKKLESERIAETLRGELEVGRWKAGERLPTVAELRNRFGTGTFAVRAAVRNLRDEGFVELRPRIGIVATEKGSVSVKGRILFVCVGARGSYFAQRLSIRLSQRFDAAQWSYMPVFLESAHDGHLDVSLLVRQIAEGARFAVVLASERQVMDVLGRAGVPYVVLNGYARDYPDAVGVVREDFQTSYDDFINVMRERHVKSVVEFDVERVMDRAFKAQLASAGIAVRRVLCERDNECPWTLADVKRLGHAAVASFFAVDRNRIHPPDVVLFDDDYLAAGGLVALYEAGLRIPGDVRVVFYSNKGNEPVLGVSAARIENDPVACADVVAKYVLKLLEGRKCQPPRNVWRFIPGDSL